MEGCTAASLASGISRLAEVELSAEPPASGCSPAVEATVDLGELFDATARVVVVEFVTVTPPPRIGTTAVEVAPLVGASAAGVVVVCPVVCVVLTVAEVVVVCPVVCVVLTVAEVVVCGVADCATVVWDALVVVWDAVVVVWDAVVVVWDALVVVWDVVVWDVVVWYVVVWDVVVWDVVVWGAVVVVVVAPSLGQVPSTGATSSTWFS